MTMRALDWLKLSSGMACLVAVLMWTAIALSACGEHRVLAAVAATAPSGTILGPPALTLDEPTTDLDAKDKEIRDLKHKLDTAQSERSDIIAANFHKHIALLQHICLWLAGLFLLGAIACVVLSVCLSAVSKWVGRAGLGLGIGVGVCLFAYRALDYIEILMPWLIGVAAAFLVAAAVWLIWRARKGETATKLSAGLADEFERMLRGTFRWLDDPNAKAMELLISRAKALAADAQARAGVRTTIAAIREKPAAPELEAPPGVAA